MWGSQEWFPGFCLAQRKISNSRVKFGGDGEKIMSFGHTEFWSYRVYSIFEMFQKKYQVDNSIYKAGAQRTEECGSLQHTG